jgi:two-component system, NarL family, invasion response regulator UvrY
MNILVADDHAIVRRGLIGLLQEGYPSVTVFQAVNSSEAIEVARKQPLDVILLDISMPGRNGIETLKQMRLDGIKTPVLILSMHPEGQYAIRCLKAGASGFINKETATEELLGAIQKVLSGKKYITPAVAEKLAESMEVGGRPLYEALSDREMQVLQQIASGKTVSEIADEISLSVNTISTYRSRILEKLQLTNNSELTRYAIENDLV